MFLPRTWSWRNLFVGHMFVWQPLGTRNRWVEGAPQRCHMPVSQSLAGWIHSFFFFFFLWHGEFTPSFSSSSSYGRMNSLFLLLLLMAGLIHFFFFLWQGKFTPSFSSSYGRVNSFLLFLLLMAGRIHSFFFFLWQGEFTPPSSYGR